MAEESKNTATAGGRILRDRYYRELLRKNLLRLALTYLAPLILLTIYFYAQYVNISRESRAHHLKSVAEHQANTLDLFLNERVVNLANLIDDPKLKIPPTGGVMEVMLHQLKKNSDTFTDVGFFDSTGVQLAYEGPLPFLENRNYSAEPWFIRLRGREDHFIITDNYLGFRQKPHFTIAVSRVIQNRYVVLRATLDPQKFYEYVISQEGLSDVDLAVVNRDGIYQLVSPKTGLPLESSSVVPPSSPRLGWLKVRNAGKSEFAYAWLRNADWAVIARPSGGDKIPLFSSRMGILVFSAVIIFGVLAVIVIRSKKLVELQIEKEVTKAQFEHAAKLASVGELSAGIAHEINNPLAIIAEEVGLIKDLMNPEFRTGTTFDDLKPHLDNIHDAVFRCRDITRKLLSFVRKTDIKLKPHHINTLIDEIVDAFWIHEMEVSNITIEKKYAADLPEIVTDGNQLKQIFLNILNNAADAITPPGKITISTSYADDHISVAISDTGKGITQEQMEKIFLPFYTTKEPGKGTGLGLSVSYGIVKSLGGKILVESIPGKGSVFTVVLPVK
jgi:two-component system NtrC family sensor kinase